MFGLEIPTTLLVCADEVKPNVSCWRLAADERAADHRLVTTALPKVYTPVTFTRGTEMPLSTCALISVAAFAAVAALSAAHAQRAPEWNFCDAKTPPDVRIQNCTVLVEARDETQRNRAIAHHFRAMAWATKGDYDRAIADYDEAIKLEPKDIDA